MGVNCGMEAVFKFARVGTCPGYYSTSLLQLMCKPEAFMIPQQFTYNVIQHVHMHLTICRDWDKLFLHKWQAKIDQLENRYQKLNRFLSHARPDMIQVHLATSPGSPRSFQCMHAHIQAGGLTSLAPCYT